MKTRKLMYNAHLCVGLTNLLIDSETGRVKSIVSPQGRAGGDAGQGLAAVRPLWPVGQRGSVLRRQGCLVLGRSHPVGPVRVWGLDVRQQAAVKSESVQAIGRSRDPGEDAAGAAADQRGQFVTDPEERRKTGPGA